jgi:hypothetical protein
MTCARRIAALHHRRQARFTDGGGGMVPLSSFVVGLTC